MELYKEKIRLAVVAWIGNSKKDSICKDNGTNNDESVIHTMFDLDT